MHTTGIAASLAPADARHEIEDRPGKLQITTVRHPLQVRGIVDLRHGVRCACSQVLVGCEFEFLHDTRGSALYVRGVCLQCGLQDVMFMGEPQQTEAQIRDRARADVAALVEQTMRVRQAAGCDETISTEAVA